MSFNKVTAEDISVFIKIAGEDRVFWGEAISEDYHRDEMTEYGLYAPECVIQAQSTEEISEILKYCNERLIPVTPRGSGTGLCGGCVAIHGGIVLSTERMKRLIEVDPVNMTATVEPGLLLMEFSKLLEGTGLFYPPDPGEKSATIGGNVMTNAGGMRAVRFGVTRDYVLGMKFVLASGEILSLGGKTVKTSSGYNLIQLICGSEGTLGFLSEITVKLIAEPKYNVSLLAPFESLSRCVEAVSPVLNGATPTAVEFMEKEVIEDSERYLGKQFPDKSANAYLLVRLDAADMTSLSPAVEQLTDILLSCGAEDVLLADTDERKTSIWDARGAFLEAIKGGTPSMDECDVVVPRNKIAAFIEESQRLSAKYSIRVRSFGHAGDGNLHIYACQDDLNDEIWKKNVQALMDGLYEKARELGGQISGEHGVGHAKKQFLKESMGDAPIAIMRGIKLAFDPNGILNPGKIV
ncbi:MAG: FAD-binding protein [Clostridia bacterium]|nr:FAD-binding protein [Clostridia bacterium]